MGKQPTVLIVEDEYLTARSLKLDLEDLGATPLDPVSRGEDAVDVALKANPDLILMDIQLAGGLDGIEAAERILKKKRIPIAFMTGYGTETFRERARKVRPVEFLDKPVNLNAVRHIIRSLAQ